MAARLIITWTDNDLISTSLREGTKWRCWCRVLVHPYLSTSDNNTAKTQSWGLRAATQRIELIRILSIWVTEDFTKLNFTKVKWRLDSMNIEYKIILCGFYNKEEWYIVKWVELYKGYKCLQIYLNIDVVASIFQYWYNLCKNVKI